MADTIKNGIVQSAVSQANELTVDMLADIKRYYIDEYGDSTKLVEENTDSTIEWRFESIPKNADDFEGTMVAIYVPRLKNMNAILHGDMNGDGNDDILMTIHTEGGGVGGNIYWSDHFLFLASGDGKYALADVEPDGAINGCGGGYFTPEKIEGGIIAGTASCYTDADGQCCPSLHYKVRVAYRQGKLIYVDHALITH